MFDIKEKNYRNDLTYIIEKLRSKQSFAFSKYADGELHILSNKPINNGEFWFNPKTDTLYRKQLIDSLRYKNDNYYVGISCPCCIGGKTVHEWYKKQSDQKLENLTWANIFVNGNHKYYIENMVPLYSNYDVILVSNTDSNLQRLPFEVKKHFKIGKNAWIKDTDLINEMKNFIDNERVEKSLFLFCAGPFGNILVQQLFDYNKKNTYIDIGSTLNHYLLGKDGNNRGYLRGERSINKVCIWSEQ